MKLCHAGLETVLHNGAKYFKFKITFYFTRSILLLFLSYTTGNISGFTQIETKMVAFSLEPFWNNQNTIKNGSCNVETAHFKFEVAILNLK